VPKVGIVYCIKTSTKLTPRSIISLTNPLEVVMLYTTFMSILLVSHLPNVSILCPNQFML